MLSSINWYCAEILCNTVFCNRILQMHTADYSMDPQRKLPYFALTGVLWSTFKVNWEEIATSSDVIFSIKWKIPIYVRTHQTIFLWLFSGVGWDAKMEFTKVNECPDLETAKWMFAETTEGSCFEHCLRNPDCDLVRTESSTCYLWSSVYEDSNTVTCESHKRKTLADGWFGGMGQFTPNF